MPKRTLAEARRVLEEGLAPTLNDYWLRTHREALAQAEAKARQEADKFLGPREEEVRAIRDEALRELTEVRDGYEELTAEGPKGRITAAEYTKRLHELAARQARAEAALEDAEEKVSAFERVEDDPIAWFDDLATRMPGLKGDFPW